MKSEKMLTQTVPIWLHTKKSKKLQRPKIAIDFLNHVLLSIIHNHRGMQERMELLDVMEQKENRCVDP